MDNTSSVFLPYILQTLSRKPEFCASYKNICEEIKHFLATENLLDHHKNIEKSIDDALDVGQNLGVLVLTNDLIRMSFKYNNNSETAGRRSILQKNAQKMVTSSQLDLLFTQPRRTHSVRPTVIPLGHRRKSSRVRKGSRARRGSRTRSRSRRGSGSRPRRGSRRRS